MELPLGFRGMGTDLLLLGLTDTVNVIQNEYFSRRMRRDLHALCNVHTGWLEWGCGGGDTVQKYEITTWPAGSETNLWHSPAWIQEVGCSGNGWNDGGNGADVPVLQPGCAESSWGRGQLLWWGRGSMRVLGDWLPLLWAAGLAVGFQSLFSLASQTGWVTLS